VSTLHYALVIHIIMECFILLIFCCSKIWTLLLAIFCMCSY